MLVINSGIYYSDLYVFAGQVTIGAFPDRWCAYKRNAGGGRSEFLNQWAYCLDPWKLSDISYFILVYPNRDSVIDPLSSVKYLRTHCVQSGQKLSLRVIDSGYLLPGIADCNSIYAIRTPGRECHGGWFV